VTQECDKPRDSGVTAATVGVPIVCATDVEVSFAGARAVAAVSLSIAPGETVALMGPSGSGKSTLLLALAGLQPINGGTVSVHGQHVWNLTARQRSALRLHTVGMVFQSADLIPELSLVDNVALPIEVAGAARRESLRRATTALEALGLDVPTMGRCAGEVSGGQQQRAAIARAMANNPRLVLADEPTAALDSHARQVVMHALARHARAGNAVVIATHDTEVAQAASRVVHMRDGEIVR